MKFYRLPNTHLTVYETLRIGINHLFGYPKTVTTELGTVTTETFLPLWESLPEVKGNKYFALRDTEYAHEWVGPLIDQNVAGLHVTEITEHQYRNAIAQLPDNDDPPPPAGPQPWVQPAGAHDAYDIGAKVTHDGKTWESTTAANIWEPGVFGWEEIQ